MITYDYWVIYIEDGEENADWWCKETLAEEFAHNEVKILSVQHRSQLPDDDYWN